MTTPTRRPCWLWAVALLALLSLALSAAAPAAAQSLTLSSQPTITANVEFSPFYTDAALTTLATSTGPDCFGKRNGPATLSLCNVCGGSNGNCLPDPPASSKSRGRTSSTIILSWTTGQLYTNAVVATILSYRVYETGASVLPNFTQVTVPGSSSQFTITGLTPSTSYTVEHSITTQTTAGQSTTPLASSVAETTLGNSKVIVTIDSNTQVTLPPVQITSTPVTATNANGTAVVLASNPKISVTVPAGTFPSSALSGGGGLCMDSSGSSGVDPTQVAASNSNGQGSARGVNLRMGVCTNDPSEIGSSGSITLLQPLQITMTFETAPLLDLTNVISFQFYDTTNQSWVDTISECNRLGFTGIATTLTAPANASGLYTLTTFVCHFTQFAVFELPSTPAAAGGGTGTGGGTTTSSSTSTSESFPLWAIIVAAVGGAAVVTVAVWLTVVGLRRRRRRRLMAAQSKAEEAAEGRPSRWSSYLHRSSKQVEGPEQGEAVERDAPGGRRSSDVDVDVESPSHSRIRQLPKPSPVPQPRFAEEEEGTEEGEGTPSRGRIIRQSTGLSMSPRPASGWGRTRTAPQLPGRASSPTSRQQQQYAQPRSGSPPRSAALSAALEAARERGIARPAGLVDPEEQAYDDDMIDLDMEDYDGSDGTNSELADPMEPVSSRGDRTSSTEHSQSSGYAAIVAPGSRRTAAPQLPQRPTTASSAQLRDKVASVVLRARSTVGQQQHSPGGSGSITPPSATSPRRGRTVLSGRGPSPLRKASMPSVSGVGGVTSPRSRGSGSPPQRRQGSPLRRAGSSGRMQISPTRSPSQQQGMQVRAPTSPRRASPARPPFVQSGRASPPGPVVVVQRRSTSPQMVRSTSPPRRVVVSPRRSQASPPPMQQRSPYGSHEEMTGYEMPPPYAPPSPSRGRASPPHRSGNSGRLSPRRQPMDLPPSYNEEFPDDGYDAVPESYSPPRQRRAAAPASLWRGNAGAAAGGGPAPMDPQPQQWPSMLQRAGSGGPREFFGGESPTSPGQSPASPRRIRRRSPVQARPTMGSRPSGGFQ